MPMPSIDLNCDLGESFGRWTLGHDAALMESISSCNIACGYHAGDPEVMRRTVRLARDNGVAIGAHPGLPDLVGFGRRPMSVTPAEVEDLVLYQIGALEAIARAEGVRLQHVKAHGALYNMAIRDRALADAIARAVAAFDRTLLLFGLPGTELLRAGEAAGLPVAAEGFADRIVRIGRIADPAQPAWRASSTIPEKSSRAPCAWRARAWCSTATAKRSRCASRRFARTATRPARTSSRGGSAKDSRPLASRCAQ